MKFDVVDDGNAFLWWVPTPRVICNRKKFTGPNPTIAFGWGNREMVPAEITEPRVTKWASLEIGVKNNKLLQKKKTARVLMIELYALLIPKIIHFPILLLLV